METEPEFDPAVCKIKCSCGKEYDSTVNSERKEHYFHGKKEEK